MTPATSKRGFWPKKTAHQRGFRSGLEQKNAEHLAAHGVQVRYEDKASIIEYTPARTHRYTPDFVLPNGIIIETKGFFLPADRTKHLDIKREHPELDIRFVFQNPNARLNKSSKTTYAMWAEKHGFQWAKGLVPVEWIHESPPSQASA